MTTVAVKEPEESTENKTREQTPEEFKAMMAEILKENLPPSFNPEDLNAAAEWAAYQAFRKFASNEANQQQFEEFIQQNLVEPLLHSMDSRYRQYQEDRKWSGRKKALVGAGIAAAITAAFFIGRRSGVKIGNLENG